MIAPVPSLRVQMPGDTNRAEAADSASTMRSRSGVSSTTWVAAMSLDAAMVIG